MRTVMDHTIPVCTGAPGSRLPGRLSRWLIVVLFAGLLALAPGSSAFARFSALVMDAQSGEVLYSGNAELPRYPASLTKMMTLYMLFGALESGRVGLSDSITFSAHACAQPPSKLGMRPGQQISVEDAILALVTKSANDVAAAVGEHLSGSEYRFGHAMTEQAHALGMVQTTFRNASGLPDPEQVTTARDMGLLGYALLRDFPQYYHYFGTRVFHHGREAHANHNRMLFQYDGIDGIKTGYIRASGFNLVASASRQGRRLIGVVFGARSPGERGRIMASLLDNGFGGAPADSYEVLVARNLVPPRGDDGEVESRGADGDDGRVIAARANAAAEARGSRRTAPVAGIRVGAFRDRGGADSAVREARRRLGPAIAGGEVDITAVKTRGRRGGVVYVAGISGLSGEDAARACALLRKKNRGGCSVVAARSAPSSPAVQEAASVRPERAVVPAKTVRAAAGGSIGNGRQATPAAVVKTQPARGGQAKAVKTAERKLPATAKAPATRLAAKAQSGGLAAKAQSGKPTATKAVAANSAKAIAANSKLALKSTKSTKMRAAKSPGDGKVQAQKAERKKREA